MLQFVSSAKVQQAQNEDPKRDLKTILIQPKFIIAVTAAMISFTLMNLWMTATPLAMHRHGFDFKDSTFVIQWHVLAMFVPSLFTGKLIEKFGSINMIFIDAVLIGLCIIINVPLISYIFQCTYQI